MPVDPCGTGDGHLRCIRTDGFAPTRGRAKSICEHRPLDKHTTRTPRTTNRLVRTVSSSDPVDNRRVVHIRRFGVSRSLPAASVGRMRFPVLALLTTLVFLMGTAPAAADNTFGWPLEPRPTVARPFDPPEQNWLPGHRGVDLASRAGQTVLAAGDGIVVFAGTSRGNLSCRSTIRAACAPPTNRGRDGGDGPPDLRRRPTGHCGSGTRGLPRRGVPALGPAPRSRQLSESAPPRRAHGDPTRTGVTSML